jgi:hypothetical protein
MKLGELNKRLLKVKLPSEMGRRTRNLDMGSIKAEELRGFALLYFVILLQLFTDKRDVKIWAYFSFLARAYCLPDCEFNLVPKGALKAASDNFQRLVQIRYGPRYLIYNFHLMRHLEEIRYE